LVDVELLDLREDDQLNNEEISQTANDCTTKECIYCPDIYKCNDIKDQGGKGWARARLGKGVSK
jgi:hypothetical protein